MLGFVECEIAKAVWLFCSNDQWVQILSKIQVRAAYSFLLQIFMMEIFSILDMYYYLALEWLLSKMVFKSCWNALI